MSAAAQQMIDDKDVDTTGRRYERQNVADVMMCNLNRTVNTYEYI